MFFTWVSQKEFQVSEIRSVHFLWDKKDGIVEGEMLKSLGGGHVFLCRLWRACAFRFHPSGQLNSQEYFDRKAWRWRRVWMFKAANMSLLLVHLTPSFLISQIPVWTEILDHFMQMWTSLPSLHPELECLQHNIHSNYRKTPSHLFDTCLQMHAVTHTRAHTALPTGLWATMSVFTLWRKCSDQCLPS